MPPGENVCGAPGLTTGVRGAGAGVGLLGVVVTALVVTGAEILTEVRLAGRDGTLTGVAAVAGVC